MLSAMLAVSGFPVMRLQQHFRDRRSTAGIRINLERRMIAEQIRMHGIPQQRSQIVVCGVSAFRRAQKLMIQARLQPL